MTVGVPSGTGIACRSEPQGLAAQLRAATGTAHAAAEVAFALEHRLADLGAYRALLLVLQDFYVPLERALRAVHGWHLLTPAVDLPVQPRGALLAQDLRRLAPPVPRPRPGRAARGTDLPTLDTLAHALGAIYVVEGSALGGQVIARRAQTVLGDDLPVDFFAGTGHPAPRRTWRALQDSLDAFGATAGAAGREQVVHAAHQTFRALTGRLDASRGVR